MERPIRGSLAFYNRSETPSASSKLKFINKEADNWSLTTDPRDAHILKYEDISGIYDEVVIQITNIYGEGSFRFIHSDELNFLAKEVLKQRLAEKEKDRTILSRESVTEDHIREYFEWLLNYEYVVSIKDRVIHFHYKYGGFNSFSVHPPFVKTLKDHKPGLFYANGPLDVIRQVLRHMELHQNLPYNSRGPVEELLLRSDYEAFDYINTMLGDELMDFMTLKVRGLSPLSYHDRIRYMLMALYGGSDTITWQRVHQIVKKKTTMTLFEYR